MSQLIYLSQEKLADIETPVSAYIKLCKGLENSFLLESVEKKERTGRYSIIAYDPIFGIELTKDQVTTWSHDKKQIFHTDQFFSVIKDSIKNLTCDALPDLPPIGSLMGHIGYDAIRLIETLPSPHASHDIPISRLSYPSRFVIFDHMRRMMTLLAIDETQDNCLKKLMEMAELLSSPLVIKPHQSSIYVVPPPKDHYCEAVVKAKEYIKAGDIFQVVLSDRFTGETDISPFEVYRRLRIKSPSPYMFFLDFGSYQLVGSSPETLVKVSNDIVTIMAIAGTRGRSQDPKRDYELEQELLGCEKECAEHIMLTDLARNDVKRVCQFGSVSVEPYMNIIRYSHVMHIISQVQGKLCPEKDAIDAFKAGFPAGTVSGAPKVRAMEIIDELERNSRGPYAGAVGYFSQNNQMDMCIAIRTILFHNNTFRIQVGAGIVADSIPEMEYKEISNKAAQSIHALKQTAEG